MNSLMASIRARNSSVLNPTITSDFAEKMASELPLGSFDIFEDLQTVMQGSDPVFMQDVTSRLAWMLDTGIVNRLKTVSLKLTKHEGPTTIDTGTETELEIDEIWHAELNSIETGYNANGPMSQIVAALTVREAWHDYAQLAATTNNRRIDEMKSIATLVGMPRRQEVTSAYKQDAVIDALTGSGIVTDVGARTKFLQGINLMIEAKAQAQVIRENCPDMTPDALEVLMASAIPTHDSVATPDAEGKLVHRLVERKLTVVETAVTERQKAISQLAVMSDKVSEALEAYEEDILGKEAEFDRFYRADLARIPQMMAVYDYCKQKMLAPGERGADFWLLPEQLQVDACANAIAALNKTVLRFKGKGYTYNTYKRTVASATELLNRVIRERCAHDGHETVEHDEAGAADRSDARRIEAKDRRDAAGVTG